MAKDYQNGVIAQLLEAIVSQVNFDGEPISNIGDILLSILEQTPYDKEPKSVLAELFLKLKNKLEGDPFTPYDKDPKSVLAEILLSILNETEYTDPPTSRIGELLLELKAELESYAEITTSGAITNFTTSLIKPLVNLTVNIDASVNGVIEVSVIHCHKNLYQYDENKVAQGTTTTSTTRAYYPIGVKGACTLTFTASLKSGESVTQSDYLNIGKLRKSDGLLEITNPFITPSEITQRTVTISNDDSFILMSLENPTVIKSILSRYDIQIEVGSYASDYEAYNGNTKVINLGGTYYNGGTLTQDKYGNTKLTADGQTIDLPDGEPIITLNGVNNIYNDSGDTSVTYLALVSDNITISAKARATIKAEKLKLKEQEKEPIINDGEIHKK